MKKTITILTPTYNEVGNIDELYSRISKVTKKNKKYNFEHLFIDNGSNDGSIEKIENIAKKNKKVKAIFNIRNFGIVSSMAHAFQQVETDACIHIASDLQDPPEVIPDLIKKWEEGFKIVVLVKKGSEETGLMFLIRRIFYRLLSKISDSAPIENSTGNGLLDRKVIKILNSIKVPIFFRGLIVELGYPIGKVYFMQRKRKTGVSSNNLYTLFTAAMDGITNQSRTPIRFLCILGFVLAILSFMLTLSYLFLKIFYWDAFQIGTAPILIGLFFFCSIQMFFMGLIGEYIGEMHNRLRKVPLVIESERINF